ncbi:MAG: SDR family oxidoreductase [Oscillospiraceae bacterium]|nr:SDR family oxidoreductase [Oscillospiraceae bacterium]
MQSKTIVITGAGGVLCGEFARFLAEQGHKVALLDLNGDSVRRLAEEICTAGGKAIGIQNDVLDKDSLKAAYKEIADRFGRVDVLVNGAGGNHPKGTTTGEYYNKDDVDAEGVVSFFDLDPEGIKFVFNLNYLGTLLPTQVFAGDITEAKGSIINISSMSAFNPLTKVLAYSGAKAAVSNLTEWLAVHFANAGVRVNAIAPGFFVTAQNKALLFDQDGNPTKRTEKILAATPMGRFGEPKELLGTLKWLVDEEQSGFVTGTVIPVDGGFAAYAGV